MKYNFDQIIDRSGTHTVKYDLRKLYFGTEEVNPMWVADMDFKTPDFIVSAIKRRAGHEIYGYTLHPASFYQAAVQWFAQRHNWTISAGHLQFTPGVVPALALCVLAYTSPGDKVIIQPPVYHPFFSVVKNNGRQLVENPLTEKNGRYYMDFDDLRRKIDKRTKALILCSPHNPVGRVWTKEELRLLCDICYKNNVLIISDEIHCDLVFEPHKHIPTAKISKEIANMTVTCIAPSKTFNMAGLSTSLFHSSNPELLADFKKTAENLFIHHGNLFGITALEAAYNYGNDWLDQLLDYLNGNIEFAIDFIKKRMPVIKVQKPEATYLLWLDFRHLGLKPEELKQLMINEAKVGMNDGISFGEQGTGFQRLNVACPREILKNALEHIEKAIKTR